MKARHVALLIPLLLATALTAGEAGTDAGARVAIAKWFAEKPVIDGEGNVEWVPAPSWLAEKQAEGPGDPATWFEVDMKGPFNEKALCQHCGAIAQLMTPIPPNTEFVVRFKAKSIRGARILKVMRRWGGFPRPYWNSYPLTEEWQEFVAPGQSLKAETEFLNFSVVATEKPPLQPCAEGVFCIADVVVEVQSSDSKDKDAETGKTTRQKGE